MHEGKSMDHNLVYSDHAHTRCSQRGITDEVVQTILMYGCAKAVKGGATSYFLSNRGIKELRNEMSSEQFHEIEKKKHAYVVMAERGSVITVAWSQGEHCGLDKKGGASHA